jgi:hypothetical protein
MRALTVPDGFAPHGATVSRDGEVVSWDVRDNALLLIDRTWRQVTVVHPAFQGVDTILAARLGEHDRLEIVTTRGVSEYDPARKLFDVRSLTDSLPLRLAQYGPHGWNALAHLPSGYFALLRLRKGQWRVNAIPLQATGVRTAVPLLAEFADGRLAVMQRASPFRVLLVGADGRVLRAAPTAVPAVTDAAALLHLVGVFRMGDYLIRVAADLRSDLREIALLDRDGNVVRSREMDAPFGMIAVGDDGRFALGLRAQPARELVLYAVSMER